MKDYSAQRPGESVEKWYDRIADTADTRLRKMEKLAMSNKKFATAPQWAYARAMKDIQKWGGKARFGANKPATKRQLMAKISDIRTFLNAPTSSKKSIEKIYDKRLATFASTEVNAKGKGGYGVNFTWESMAKYYETGIAQTWNATFGSKTALMVIGELQKNKDQIAQKLAATDVTDWRIADDELKSAVQRALQTKGLHIRELL